MLEKNKLNSRFFNSTYSAFFKELNIDTRYVNLNKYTYTPVKNLVRMKVNGTLGDSLFSIIWNP